MAAWAAAGRLGTDHREHPQDGEQGARDEVHPIELEVQLLRPDVDPGEPPYRYAEHRSRADGHGGVPRRGLQGLPRGGHTDEEPEAPQRGPREHEAKAAPHGGQVCEDALTFATMAEAIRQGDPPLRRSTG